jgi:hypothetical protein
MIKQSCVNRLFIISFLIMCSNYLFSENLYSPVGSFRLSEMRVNGKIIEIKTKFQDLFIQVKNDKTCIIREDKNKDGILTKEEVIIENAPYKNVENKISISITSSNAFWNGEWNGGLNLMTDNLQLKKIDDDGNTFNLIFNRL